MARILAIDYGQKRTGIAVTDTLQMIANGLATVETRELEKFIIDYLAKEDVSTIVVGKPTQMNGENSENMKRIEPFFNRLKKLFPDKEITYYDEPVSAKKHAKTKPSLIKSALPSFLKTIYRA